MDEVIECMYCGADAHCMGRLGYTAHYRCRFCGMDSATETGEFEFGMHEEDYADDHLSDMDVSVDEYYKEMFG